MAKPSENQDINNRSYQFAGDILRLPRITRVLIAGMFALATTLAVSPVIDEIYIRYFYTVETAILPSFISAGLGLGMYMIGWQIIVGTVGQDQQAKMAVVWYFVVGLFAIFLVGLWLVRLITLGNASLS